MMYNRLVFTGWPTLSDYNWGAFAVDSNNQLLYVSMYFYTNELYVVDIKQQTVLWSLQTPEEIDDMYYDNMGSNTNYLYLFGRESVMVVDPMQKKVVKVMQKHVGYINAIVVDPMTKEVYDLQSDNNQETYYLSVYSLDTLNVMSNVSFPDNGYPIYNGFVWK